MLSTRVGHSCGLVVGPDGVEQLVVTGGDDTSISGKIVDIFDLRTKNWRRAGR